MSPKPEHILRSQGKPPESSELPATPQQLFYRVKQDILATSGPGFLKYTGILPAVGYQVARSLGLDSQVEQNSLRLSYNPDMLTLSVTMPTIFHNCHVSWAVYEFMCASVAGFFTLNEAKDLDLSSHSRFDNFPVPWQNIYKEPDAYIKPAGAALPTIVFEAGYTESYPHLVADSNLWFTGGASIVNVIVLLKWSLISGNRVKGFIELWRSGAPNPRRIDIFPAPAPGTPAQIITFYRRDFYVGGAVPAGRNPNDTWSWDIDTLRIKADRAIRDEGHVPA